MQEFKVEKKLYLKSHNSVSKIFIRYLYCIILISLIFIGKTIYRGSYEALISFIINAIISFGILFVIELLFNKQKNIKILDFLINNNLLVYSLTISLFTIRINLMIPMLATLLVGLIKNINRKGEYGSLVYGLLFIICYKSFFLGNQQLINLNSFHDLKITSDFFDLLFGFNTYSIVPIIALGSFIFLFLKKSIKYNIFIYYMLSFGLIMLLYGLFNKLGFMFLVYQLCTQNMIFMCIYLLCDYRSSPITIEGQAIYGFLLGILTCVLKFIMPVLSIILPMIIGPILLTKPIDRLSIKIKYNKKLYTFIIVVNIVLVLITSIILINI